MIGIVALFAGSLGVPMYEHYCAQEQETFHTLFAESRHCETKTALHEDACCAEKKGVSAERKSCCSDELKNLSLTFHFFEQLKKQAFSLVAVIPENRVISINWDNVSDPLNHCFPDTADPPPLSVRERLSLVNNWRL